jgi:hypothetical protein
MSDTTTGNQENSCELHEVLGAFAQLCSVVSSRFSSVHYCDCAIPEFKKGEVQKVKESENHLYNINS